MNVWHIRGVELPADQLALRRRCFHRSGDFAEFPVEDVSTSIPACFEKAVRRQGGRLAVKTSSRGMTYEELNRAANRLAHLLVASRRGAEPVAVYLSDRVSMIVAILAVLKAGKFFVPLETSFPASRNAYVLNDCGAELIVTDRANLHGAEALGGSTRLLLIEESETVADAHDPDVPIGSDDLVYVLHTSGSSGQFKGIGESHRNVLYDICWFVNYVHVGTADRLTLLHPLSSAAAGLHLYGSLLTGAAVFPYDLAGTGADGVARWLRDEEITIWHSLPGVFRQMIETLRHDERLAEVRLVQLSSAPVIENDIQQYRTHFAPECLFLHRIGSTEALTISARLMDQRTAIESEPLPLGWSPDAKQVLILDDDGGPAAAGAPGEIAVRSRFLAHGYWGKPELSPEKFQKDSSGDDTWIFLTGDLGRVTPEGGLTLLGRKDLQLKVRGFRVEPEQIERVLQRHPSVKEAVVIGNSDADGSAQLVGYFTIVEPPAPKVDALRQFLAERLPDYMIPARFVRLDRLPLTPNGKVDRRALPASTRERPDLSVPYSEATSAIERTVAEIWQEALYVDPIGLHDNFLDLGGHSLSAMRILSAVNEIFGVELPLQVLFDAPTVAKIAPVIVEQQGQHAGNDTLESLLSEIEAMSEDDAELQIGLKAPQR